MIVVYVDEVPRVRARSFIAIVVIHGQGADAEAWTPYRAVRSIHIQYQIDLRRLIASWSSRLTMRDAARMASARRAEAASIGGWVACPL